MKFIIVGASGFVGSNFLRYFKEAGYEVIGTKANSLSSNLIKLDLLSDRIENCIPVEFYRDQNEVVAIICSCISQIDRCFRERELSFRVNVQKTNDLIRDLGYLNIKPVFLSTSAVFDGIFGYYNETDRRCPVSEYGRQKVAVEEYIEEHSPNALIMRLDKLVSDDPKQNHMFSEWYRCIEERRPIISIMEQHFSPTFVDDVAKGIDVACKGSLNGLYHVSNTEFFTRDELARQFSRAMGSSCKFTVKPEVEFNFSDRRTLKAYLDATKFLNTTKMRFTSMSDLFGAFKQKLQN